MEFALLVALTGLAALWQHRRERWGPKEILFFGGTAVVARLWHRCRFTPGDPLPAVGPVIVISNHTCSADGMFLQVATRRPLSWLSSQEHYDKHPLIRAFLDWLHSVPVRRDGVDVAAARMALTRLAEGRALGIFPEGNLSGIIESHDDGAAG